MGNLKVRVFFSYAHRDERLVNQFMSHLAPLKRMEWVEIWHDGEIRAGDTWKTSISEMLETAHLILMFITPDFIASTYCYEVEMKRALERHKAGEAWVIPIIVRPTENWKALFGELQVVPKDGRAVTTWTNRDQAWADIIRRIHEVIRQLTGDTSLNGEQDQSINTGKVG